MADTGPPINGFEALIREVESLRQRVRALENGNSRFISIGTSYRIQIRAGTSGVGAILDAVRPADGNTVQLAP